MQKGARNLITDVPGLLVGNAEDHHLKSGVTTVLCDPPATAAVQVLGGAPGTRETDLLAPHNMMRIILADEISPDSCRLWDIETKEKMDKDRFRRDMGGLVEAYQEVARRLGIINENEPPRGSGPVLVK